MNNLHFGLCTWNFWGDAIVDRPDNTDEMVVSYIVNWLLDRGMLKHDQVCQLQHHEPNPPIFTAEVPYLRKRAFDHIRLIDENEEFPKLDIIFCRWRWDVGMINDPRLRRQDQMLAHYANTGTQILIWDEDFQLTQGERDALRILDNVTIIETSEAARVGDLEGVSYVPHPIALDIETAMTNVLPRWSAAIGDHVDPMMRLAYVGNNYEREEFVDKYLKPFSYKHPATVHMYGNWLKYNDRVMHLYPHIQFHPKVGRTMRDWVYQHAISVPMLAKNVYFKNGHITPRLHEVVTAGGIPIGFKRFKGAEKYFLSSLTVDTADDLIEVTEYLTNLQYHQRCALMADQLMLLRENRVFDVDYFFKCIGLS